MFESTDAAAAHNASILQRFDYDLAKAFQAQHTSPVGIGSEFRNPALLDDLLCRHPLWRRLRPMLEFGAHVPLAPMSTKSRLQDLTWHLQRGNHKSADKNQPKIRELLNEDVIHGYSLILPLNCLPHLKNASIAPLGLQEQGTINELGERVTKWRMTHDQTFPGESGLSVNRRTDMAALQPCMFGFALSRLLHYIVDLRSRHPTSPILIGKIDLKAAYRRAHLHPDTVAECLTVFDGRLNASLRMTFGGAAFPSMWSNCSEIIGDLANDLILCPDWNPSELHSPLQHLIPPPLRPTSHEPFAQAKPMSVTLPVNDKGLVEVYLDDIPPVCVDIGDNVDRCNAAVPLAVHLLGRAKHHDEPIPRDEILSIKKILGEGQMAETKVFLGWELNTRSLSIRLTDHKFEAWGRDISTLLAAKSVTIKFMHTTVGRLNHVAFLIPGARHFLSRLRAIVTRGRHRNQKWGRLLAPHKADLRLFQGYLRLANRGVSMNNIVHRLPTHHYRSDASQAGIGGYSIDDGTAWRFALPADILQHITLNTLEFIGCLVTIWIDLLRHKIPPQSCLLSQTDSTSAEGWLRKSNFDAELCPTQLIVARQLASLVIQADCCLYSQWFPGSQNVVSDLLSRRFDLTDDALVSLILSTAPDQVPCGIQLLPLPTEIASWLTSLWLKPAASKESQSKLTIPTPERGPAGTSICSPSESDMTLSWTVCPEANDIVYLVPSPKQSATPDSVPRGTSSSLVELSLPPSRTWHRPSGLTTGQTHALTSTGKSPSFYDDN